MSYSKLYFGKELSTLTYEDIENFFFNEKDESNKIEFKSYYDQDEKNHKEKLNGVIRAICALLNSEGGIVIWGAPIGQSVANKKEKIFKGALSPSKILIEKDSFISKVADLITPSPKGIYFQPIEKNGEYVYVIEIEKSFYSPHQFRNIYYMRMDGQTKPAPHHFIEALFRKVTFPKLEGYIIIDSIETNGQNYIMQISNMIFNKSKLQNEHEIYYRVLLTVGRYANFNHYTGNDKIYTSNGFELMNLNAKSTLYYNEPYSNTETIIINPNDLIKRNYECQILFFFGGKQSPLMISKYKLRINNIHVKDTNDLIISMEENRYTYETQELPDKERMKLIIGR